MGDLFEAIKDNLLALLYAILPAAWQRVTASLGLALLTPFFSNGKHQHFALVGTALIVFAVGGRVITRLRLNRYAHSQRLEREIESAAYGALRHRLLRITRRDELVVLGIEATSPEPASEEFPLKQLPVVIVLFRKRGGIWLRNELGKIEYDVRKLIGAERHWERLAAFAYGGARTFVYVVWPFYGNRYRNRSAHVKVFSLDDDMAPVEVTFASHDDDARVWRGQLEIPNSQNVPDSIWRAIVHHLGEAGFVQEEPSPYDIAARRWQAEFAKYQDAIITGDWFHVGSMEGAEPIVMIGELRFHGGWRDAPILELRSDGQARIVKIARDWARIATVDGLLVISDMDGLSAYDPATRRLWRFSTAWPSSLQVQDDDLYAVLSPTGQRVPVRALIAEFAQESRERGGGAPMR